MRWRLQPYAMEAATLRGGGCNAVRRALERNAIVAEVAVGVVQRDATW